MAAAYLHKLITFIVLWVYTVINACTDSLLSSYKYKTPSQICGFSFHFGQQDKLQLADGKTSESERENSFF